MRVIYPYDVLVGEVGMEINVVTVDGVRLPSSYINPDTRQVTFENLQNGWTVAAIKLTLTAPAAELNTNTTWEAVTAVLRVSCSASRSRQSVKMDPDPDTPGRWIGTVELERALFYGRAAIEGVVVATVDGRPHREIGTTEGWTVFFDDLPASPVHGSIRVQWTDFESDEGRPYLRGFRTDPYYLRIDPDDPTLLLNKGFKGLEALLADRKRRPAAERALHDSTRGNIANNVWAALFIVSLEAVESDTDSGLPEWPPVDWQEVVLRGLLARIYPDSGPEDALVKAVQALKADGIGELLERLLPATARQVRAPQLLRSAIGMLADDDSQGL